MIDCAECSSEFSCSKCSGGYRWDNQAGYCRHYYRMNAFAIVIIVISGVGLLVFFLSCCLTICAARRQRARLREHQQQQVEQQYHVTPETLNKFQADMIYFKAEKDECSICLEGETNCITVCQHYFHFDCLKEWTKHKTFCPNCKAFCLDLKSRCPECKHFSRNFKMCNSNCGMPGNHFGCVAGQLQGPCVICVNN